MTKKAASKSQRSAPKRASQANLNAKLSKRVSVLTVTFTVLSYVFLGLAIWQTA